MEQKRINISSIFFVTVITVYMLTICGILLTVILNSFSRDWFSGVLPKTYTTEWYKWAANHHDIPHLIYITLLVVALVVGFSLLIAFPAAYVIAKRNFLYKSTILALFLLPMIIPPMSYGLPLATVLYKFRLAPNLSGVIISNMVPTVSFMILVLVPFIEQVGDNLESAARMLGANKLRVFSRVIIPLTMPGILSAVVLSIVRTISMFELTFLVCGAKTQTLVVALFTDVYAPGFRPFQAIDALAVIFFLLTMSTFVISLKFVNPTQMVLKIK
ncbi:MAG: ABC transporter permease [Acetivibrionales bacterium]|jgi:putative spermidine/putrescine transport system permease protein